MSESTNSLVAKVKRFAVPVGAVAALLFAITFMLGHNSVHAASWSPSSIDDNSVSSLVSLDNAMEAVAARVTPAVVNVSVTSRGNSEMEAGDDQNQGQGGGQQGGIPPGFEWFFGPQGPQG